MKIFRTSYVAKKEALTLDYSDQFFLMGSCFSSNISTYLSARKFETKSNPYGILFNPISIFQAIEEIVLEKKYTKDDLVFHKELFHSLQHHSDFSGTDASNVLKQINTRIEEAHAYIKKCSTLVLTFGTAWVYSKEGKVVANCHKIPNTEFEKNLLSVATIEAGFARMEALLKKLNPSLELIITLSPVRHLKDGFVENNLSKSLLRIAIEAIQKKYRTVHYFPAYEIVLDDLRDYRFFEKDMLHPSAEAVAYVWGNFVASYFEQNMQEGISRMEKLQAAIAHRPRFENTEAHQKHLAFIAKEKESLKAYFVANNVPFPKGIVL